MTPTQKELAELMSAAPEHIWAWVWNTPAIKAHGTNCWTDYEPVFKVWVLKGLPSKKHWFGAPKVYTQTATQYVRNDVHYAVVAERDALAIRISALESTPTDEVV